MFRQLGLIGCLPFVACVARSQETLTRLEGRLEKIEARLDELSARSQSSATQASKTSARVKEIDDAAEEKARPLREAAELVKEVERLAALGYTDANSPDVRRMKARFLELLEVARQAVVTSGSAKR